VGALAAGHVIVLGLGGVHAALAVWLARLVAVSIGERMAGAAPDPRGRPAAPRGLKGGWSFRGSFARRRALAQRIGAPCLLALAVAGPLPEGPTWLPWRMAAKAGAALGRAFEGPTHWLLAARDAAPLAADGALSPVGLAFLLALAALAWAPWARIYARLPSWRLPLQRLLSWRPPLWRLLSWRPPSWRRAPAPAAPAAPAAPVTPATPAASWAAAPPHGVARAYAAGAWVALAATWAVAELYWGPLAAELASLARDPWGDEPLNLPASLFGGDVEAAPLRTPGSLERLYIKGPRLLLYTLLGLLALARVGALALAVVLPAYTFFAAWRLWRRARAAWRAGLPGRLAARAARHREREVQAAKWSCRWDRFEAALEKGLY
jgi:hypothetical protein